MCTFLILSFQQTANGVLEDYFGCLNVDEAAIATYDIRLCFPVFGGHRVGMKQYRIMRLLMCRAVARSPAD